MLCGNSDENGNAIRDYDTAKRIRRRVTLQQKQFKDYNLYRMNGEKDFGTHKTILIAIIYNMKLMSIYGRPSISCEATIFQSYFSE